MSTFAEELKSHRSLEAALQICTEEHAGELLAAEIKGRRRSHILIRIHQRITMLRRDRERHALVKIASKKTRNGGL